MTAASATPARAGQPGAGRIPFVHWNKRQRTLDGHPTMGLVAMNVLIALYNAKAAGDAFIAIEGIHQRTLNTMQAHDWIFASDGIDGTRYKITGRGERLMRVYLQPVHRRDGICPRCNTAPRAVRSSGVIDSYCRECQSAIARRKRTLKIVRHKPRPCSMCKTNTTHRYPNGTYSSYCLECDRIRSRRRNTRERAERAARVRAGEFVKCKRRVCSAPVHNSGRCVYDLCYDHLQQQRIRARDRHYPHRQAARRRRYADRLRQHQEAG